MISATPVKLVTLRDLQIERELYGPSKDQYKGKITFDGPNGRIEIMLPEELSLKFLQASSAILAEVSADVARRMHSDVMASIEQARSLPNAVTPIQLK